MDMKRTLSVGPQLVPRTSNLHNNIVYQYRTTIIQNYRGAFLVELSALQQWQSMLAWRVRAYSAPEKL